MLAPIFPSFSYVLLARRSIDTRWASHIAGVRIGRESIWELVFNQPDSVQIHIRSHMRRNPFPTCAPRGSLDIAKLPNVDGGLTRAPSCAVTNLQRCPCRFSFRKSYLLQTTVFQFYASIFVTRAITNCYTEKDSELNALIR